MARFSSDSRYARSIPMRVTRRPQRPDEDGETREIIPPREVVPPPAVGLYRRSPGERLDHIAAAIYGDPSRYWRLCDANDALIPDAIAEREILHIPSRGD